MKPVIYRLVCIKSVLSHQKKLQIINQTLLIYRITYSLINYYEVIYNQQFYKLEKKMQKSQLFQSFLDKKDRIHRLINEKESLVQKTRFKHFEVSSEASHIKSEANAIYLAHLNTQFRDQLREFVHQEQTFVESMKQLDLIRQDLESDIVEMRKQLKDKQQYVKELDIEKDILTDKGNVFLGKIMDIQEQNEKTEEKTQKQEQNGIRLQEEIQYEKCVVKELSDNNKKMIENLKEKSLEIQKSTLNIENIEKKVKTKQSTIKNLNEKSDDLQRTLEVQDQNLTNIYNNIQSGLTQQNSQLQQIQYLKDQLAMMTKRNDSLLNNQLLQESQSLETLKNIEEDLKFQLKRVKMEKTVEEQGIIEECWKIQQQKERLQQNFEMLSNLREYLSNLIDKNEILQETLEAQIIQDHAIKKVVESKCNQPVGKKTKLYLDNIEAEQKIFDNQLLIQTVHNKQPNMCHKENRQMDWNQNWPNKVKSPKTQPRKQLELNFEPFKTISNNTAYSPQFEKSWKNSTGFTYIDTLTRVDQDG